MATIQELEQRLTAVEIALAKMQSRTGSNSNHRWWEKFDGAFADDPVFAEMVRLGREARESEPYPDYKTSRMRHEIPR